MTNPYPPIEQQICGNCRYFRNLECRRHAPADRFFGVWPKPLDIDWCGEWAPTEVAA
jgi:hypothetical protein